MPGKKRTNDDANDNVDNVEYSFFTHRLKSIKCNHPAGAKSMEEDPTYQAILDFEKVACEFALHISRAEEAADAWKKEVAKVSPNLWHTSAEIHSAFYAQAAKISNLVDGMTQSLNAINTGGLMEATMATMERAKGARIKRCQHEIERDMQDAQAAVEPLLFKRET